MANEKLTDRTILATGSAVDDLYMVVDVNDTTGSAAGTSKQQTTQNVFNSVDNLAALNANPHRSQDSFLLNDNGTAKQITYQNMHGVYSTTIALDQADITALHSTPIAAIGGASGHITQIVWASVIMTAGSGSQAGTKPTVSLYYTLTTPTDGLIAGTNHYGTLSGTRYTWVYPGNQQVSPPTETIIDVDVKIFNFGDAFTDGVWTSASIHILYRLVYIA